MNLKLCGPLVAVSNMEKSLAFYTQLLGEQLRFDFGACQQLQSGLTLQEKRSMTEFLGYPAHLVLKESINFVLYYEVDDMDAFLQKLEHHEQPEYIHGVVEYEWGQRSVSFYDPDHHAVDVSECMESVFRRFLAQGMTVEEISQRTEHPIAFVRSSIEQE